MTNTIWRNDKPLIFHTISPNSNLTSLSLAKRLVSPPVRRLVNSRKNWMKYTCLRKLITTIGSMWVVSSSRYLETAQITNSGRRLHLFCSEWERNYIGNTQKASVEDKRVAGEDKPIDLALSLCSLDKLFSRMKCQNSRDRLLLLYARITVLLLADNKRMKEE